MQDDDPLKTALLDFLWELRDEKFPVILGGGYGLFLKQLHLMEDPSYRPLIPSELWPRPRGTNDLDILLTAEVVTSRDHFLAIRRALDRLGYEVKVEFTQCIKKVDQNREVKIDFLTGPIVEPEDLRRVRLGERRGRPKSAKGEEKVRLHAARAPEALDLDVNLFALPVEGNRSKGETCKAVVHLPHPFTLLLMKLHAFRDRKHDEEMDFARHHAMDLYRLVAMLNEGEYEQVRKAVQAHDQEVPIREARRIISEDFSQADALGVLRLREHELFRQHMDVDRLITELSNLFS